MAASFIANNLTTGFSAPPRVSLWARPEHLRPRRARLASAPGLEERFLRRPSTFNRGSERLSEANIYKCV